jgi:hypothetical protein
MFMFIQADPNTGIRYGYLPRAQYHAAICAP